MSIKPITDDITKRLLSAVKSRFGMTEEEIWKNSLILFAGSASNLKPGCNVEIVDASRNSSVVIELDCFTQIREANANAKQESPPWLNASANWATILNKRNLGLRAKPNKKAPALTIS